MSSAFFWVFFSGTSRLCWCLMDDENEELKKLRTFVPNFTVDSCTHSCMQHKCHNLWHDFPSLFVRHRHGPSVPRGKARRKKKKRNSELCKNSPHQHTDAGFYALSMQQCFWMQYFFIKQIAFALRSTCHCIGWVVNVPGFRPSHQSESSMNFSTVVHRDLLWVRRTCAFLQHNINLYFYTA